MKLEGLWYPADAGEPHRNILTTELCPNTRDGSLCCTFVLFQGQIYRELATKMAPRNFDMEGVLCRRSKPYIHTEDSERPPPPGQIMKLGNYQCSRRRACGCRSKMPPHLQEFRKDSDIIRSDTEAGNCGGFEDVRFPNRGNSKRQVTNGGHTSELVDQRLLDDSAYLHEST
jgi:hypothetical protein